MELKAHAASLMTDAFFESRPNEWDLVETFLTNESLDELDEMTYDEFIEVLRWLDEEIKRVRGFSYSEFLELQSLIEKYGEALNYDCMALGLRLRNVGSEDFSWGDLLTIVRQSPPSSALKRAIDPEEALWGIQEQLLATIADYIAAGNWQRGQGKKKNFPKPIPRPGVEEDKKIGAEALSIDDMASWLGWEK